MITYSAYVLIELEWQVLKTKKSKKKINYEKNNIHRYG